MASFERGSRTRAAIIAAASDRIRDGRRSSSLYEAQLQDCAHDGGDMPVGVGAQDLEGVAHRLQGDAAPEQDAQRSVILRPSLEFSV